MAAVGVMINDRTGGLEGPVSVAAATPEEVDAPAVASTVAALRRSCTELYWCLVASFSPIDVAFPSSSLVGACGYIGPAKGRGVCLAAKLIMQNPLASLLSLSPRRNRAKSRR